VIEYATILRSAGLKVAEVPGWRSNGHDGDFTAQGGMWHHTTVLNDLETLVRGRSDLPGPIANLYLRRDGSYTVVCGGVAWHAGPGALSVLEDLRKGVAPKGDAQALGLADDTRIANHFLIGIECEGGINDTDDFPDVQLEALITGSAALSRALGLRSESWIHHREWTNRKPDMGHRGNLRGRLADALGGAAPVASPSAMSVPHDEPAAEVALQPPPPPVNEPEDVMYVVIQAPDRHPAFFTPDGQGHIMGRGGWTFINRFHTKHPGLVVFDTSFTTEEYDLVVRQPISSADEELPGLPPGIGLDDGLGDTGIGGAVDDPPAQGDDSGPVGPPPGQVSMPPDLLHLPDDVPEPSVGTFH
jgi:hypothetical protein